MASEDQAQTQQTPGPRLFYTIAQAEDAYRTQVQLTESLTAKFDELGGTIGGKLDGLGDKFDELATLLRQLLGANPAATSSRPVPPVVPVSPPRLSPLLPSKLESTPFDLPPPPPVTDPTTGLRPLALSRSQSDPEVNPRRSFLQRDRSLPLPSQPQNRIPIQPFRRSPSPSKNADHTYKPMTGIKLPSFHGR